MRTAELAPGTILQQMYLRDRLSRRAAPAGEFVDLGAGTGQMSNVLLTHGWRGVGVDLNSTACEKNSLINQAFVSKGLYAVREGNFVDMHDLGRADLVISSMVLEHLDAHATRSFFDLVRGLLSPDGALILLVPGSPRHWGIEDEIAGHLRRFERTSIREELERHGFQAEHVAGLTYPISNLLLPISNRLVERAERDRLSLSAHDRTVHAGDRNVRFKTSFPAPLHWAINRITMYPFHIAQKMSRQHRKSLVLYVEARPL